MSPFIFWFYGGLEMPNSLMAMAIVVFINFCMMIRHGIRLVALKKTDKSFQDWTDWWLTPAQQYRRECRLFWVVNALSCLLIIYLIFPWGDI